MGLVITDSGDGTGGSAAVSGTNVAAANTLYSAAFTGEMGAQSWTLVGTRTGDGSIAIASPSPVPLGFYLWRLDSVFGGATTVFSSYQNLSDATAAFHKRILDAVAVRINSLGLAGLASADVREKWLPRVLPRAARPTVLVCPGDGESFPGVLTGKDDVGLPVTVGIVYPTGDDEAAGIAEVALWRQKILRALEYQRLSGVPEVLNAIPERARIIDQGAFVQNKQAVGSIGVRFVLRWTRGLT